MLSEQVSVLIRDELKLARLEMTSKGKQAALGAGMFGASGVVAIYGLGCLLACAVIAISGAVAAWLAALIGGARWRWLAARTWRARWRWLPARIRLGKPTGHKLAGAAARGQPCPHIRASI